MRKTLGALALALLLTLSAAARETRPLAILGHEPDSLLMAEDGSLVYTAVTPGATGSSHVTGLIALDAQGYTIWQAPLAPAIPGDTALQARPEGSVAFLGALPFGRYYLAGYHGDGRPEGQAALLPEGAVFPTLLEGAVWYTRYQGFTHPAFATSGHDGMWRLGLSGEAERLSFADQPDLTSLTGVLRADGQLIALARDEAFTHALLRLDEDGSVLWRYSLPGGFAPSRFAAAVSPEGETLVAFNLFAREGQEVFLLRLGGYGQEISFAPLRHDSLPSLRMDHLAALPGGGYWLLGQATSQAEPGLSTPFELSLDSDAQPQATRWYPADARLYPSPRGTLAVLRDLEGLYARDSEVGYDSPPWCLLMADDLNGPALPDIHLQTLP